MAFGRKDDIQAHFAARVVGLPHLRLNQLFVPTSEGRLAAVLDGWGASVVPRLLVQDHMHRGVLTDITPGHTLSVPLYWHCWNLASEVLDQLTAAIAQAAAEALRADCGCDPATGATVSIESSCSSLVG